MKSTAIRRPDRLLTAVARDTRRRAAAIGLHIDLGAARLVRDISQPFAVGRQRRLVFVVARRDQRSFHTVGNGEDPQIAVRAALAGDEAKLIVQVDGVNPARLSIDLRK